MNAQAEASATAADDARAVGVPVVIKTLARIAQDACKDEQARAYVESLGKIASADVRELIQAAHELRRRQRDYLSQPKGARDEAKGRLVGLAAERLDIALLRTGL